jgi:membrane-associated protein
MEWLSHIVDFFIHLDHHITSIVENYGTWTYLFVFLIIFCETGLVVTPFLPGDSLLFVLGALAAAGSLNPVILIILLIIAAVLGDSVNYAIGRALAPKVFRHEKIRFIKPEYLERTEKFYQKYGGKTIIFARFIPIIRTFAPFLAGVGSMSYGRFLFYNIIGGIIWIVLLIGAGFFFGNLPIVEKNFTLVIFAIIIISFVPAAIEYFNHKSGN